MSKQQMTYDYLCFGSLINESFLENKKVLEKRIKRRLRYYSLGVFDHTRVDYIRSLKNILKNEFSKRIDSQYHIGVTGKYASPDNFDFDRMMDDFLEKYPDVTRSDMGRMINYSLYYWYLR